MVPDLHGLIKILVKRSCYTEIFLDTYSEIDKKTNCKIRSFINVYILTKQLS